MKKVEGYVLEDGRFYEKRTDARYHECETALTYLMGKSILVTPERAEDFIAFIEQNFSIVTEFCNAVKDKLSDIGEKAPVDELKRMEEGETFTIANEETENAPTTEQGKSEDQDEETVTRSGRRRSFAKHVDEQVEDLPLEVEPERVDG